MNCLPSSEDVVPYLIYVISMQEKSHITRMHAYSNKQHKIKLIITL